MNPKKQPKLALKATDHDSDLEEPGSDELGSFNPADALSLDICERGSWTPTVEVRICQYYPVIAFPLQR